MIAIVGQSINNCWKGFHPLQVKSKPSGEKLHRQEEGEAKAEARQNGNRLGIMQKFKSEDWDLSFWRSREWFLVAVVKRTDAFAAQDSVYVTFYLVDRMSE